MYGEKNVYVGKYRSVLYNIIIKINRDINVFFNIIYKFYIYCIYSFIMVLLWMFNFWGIKKKSNFE